MPDAPTPKPRIQVDGGPGPQEYLRETLGAHPFSDIALHQGTLVLVEGLTENSYTPRPGIATTTRLDEIDLQSFANTRCQVVRLDAHQGQHPTPFPRTAAHAALRAAKQGNAPHLRHITDITQTPTYRADGTLNQTPGIDPQTNTLYTGTIRTPHIPTNPTKKQVAEALHQLQDLDSEFPYATPHDRATLHGYAKLPLIRAIAKPPYPLLAITAPTPGTGKSLLAQLLRTIHGGTIRSPWASEEELRKTITSLLTSTNAPIIQFDNIRSRIESPTLECLLTSDTWTDRRMAESRETTAHQNRIWIATGNNITIGGDTARRTNWITLDTNTEHPEQRPIHRHPNLIDHAQANRAQTIANQCTLINHWIAEGKPTPPTETSDHYAHTTATLRGIWATAGAEGQHAHPHTRPTTSDPNREKRATILHALHAQHGEQPWTAAQAKTTIDNDPNTETRDIGEWLKRNRDTPTGNLTLRHAGIGHRKVATWRIETR